MECKLREIVTLGDKGGAGHLIICDVVCIHLDETVIDARGRIDPDKMDLMGRMGRAYYVRASGKAIHTVYQAVQTLTIGYDSLPESIRLSKILTGNHLGTLAGMEELPGAEIMESVRQSPEVQSLMENGHVSALHQLAAIRLDQGQIPEGAAILLLADGMNGE